MRSMTGLGIGEAAFATTHGGPGRLVMELRSLNHRFLDVRVRAPSELPDLVTTVEVLARERLTRGRFDVAIRVEGTALGAMVLDHHRARSVYRALVELRDELAPNETIPLSVLAAVPDLFVPSIEQEGDSLRAAVVVAFDAALGKLDEMRIREGLALTADLERRLASIRRLAARIGQATPHTLEAYKRRLKERAERLKSVSDLEIDQGRLEQEIALFADRIDIAEELTRLESHTAHFEGMLAATDAVGRRLDFLLQEMAREANTIGSKSQDVEISHAVVELKAEIERMREQVQNVE